MKLVFSHTRREADARYSVVLTADGREPREMYLEIPAELEPLVGGHYANALALLSLFECMKAGGEVQTDTTLEKELVANLERFSAVWAFWAPGEYKPVSYVCGTYSYAREGAAAGTSEDRRDIMAYSGGVDASYVLAHSMTPGSKPQISIGAAVLLHGADIPLADKAVFDKVYKQSCDNLKEWGIPLYPVRTNVREYNPDWEHIFFCVVMAALRLFSPTYRRGVAGTDQTCDGSVLLTPWGENPITDAMLSTPEFACLPLGLVTGRTGRCNVLKQFPSLLEKVRVCWQSNANGGNCGICEKCIRTKLNLMACGVEVQDLPFREPFNVKQLEKLPLAKDAYHLSYYTDILEWDLTHEHHFPQELVQALESYIRRSRADILARDCRRKFAYLPFVERNLVRLAVKSMGVVSALRNWARR